jgi:hypothetical protein
MRAKRKLHKLRKDEVLYTKFNLRAGHQLDKEAKNILSREWIEDQIEAIENNN